MRIRVRLGMTFRTAVQVAKGWTGESTFIFGLQNAVLLRLFLIDVFSPALGLIIDPQAAHVSSDADCIEVNKHQAIRKQTFFVNDPGIPQRSILFHKTHVSVWSSPLASLQA